MRYLLVFWLMLFSTVSFAQINLPQASPAVKDPFFGQNNPPANSGEKVQLVNADVTKKDNNYGGNPYFSGNVVFEHQGSRLSADLVIWYQAQNFVKAIGHVKLLNADGSTITSDEMEYDGNTQKGLARKDVVLTDPKQTIRTQTLYYDRPANLAYFNTGGTITTGESTIFTRTGSYNIASRTIDLTGQTRIENAEYIVQGDKIVQNQNTNIATFTGPTTIINKKNPANQVFTERGTYNQSTREVFLNRNSTIFYNGKTLKGDEMYYNQITNFGRARGNVILNDPAERRFIKGGYGEIYERKDSAVVTEKPYAVKILEKDSIYFGAEKIIAFQRAQGTSKKKSFLRAYRQARLFKTNIQGRADSLAFDETDGILHLFGSPMAWSGAKQVAGDQIDAYFNTSLEQIDSLKVNGNAMVISKVDSLSLNDEFNQVKGKMMTVYYEKNELKLAKVIGNAQAISYADDTNPTVRKPERIGVALSTCGIIEALFEERKLQILTCAVGAQTDTYPMSLIDNAKRFLPNFNWNTRDRLQKWQDIFLATPNYPGVVYKADNPLYEAAKAAAEKQKAAEAPATPRRPRR